MPDCFKLEFPMAGRNVERALKTGEILFVLGANGSGKSGLISRLFSGHNQHAKRISAHRQTWFTSNTLDLTPHRRENLENNIRSQDQQIYSRWREDFAAERAGAAVYDLIDTDTMLAREIADLVRSEKIAEAQDKAKSPSSLQSLNELLQLSNLPIEISIEKGQRIMASRNGSAAYSVAELSDGERNAFLIAAAILTAEAGTLLLIDEPERHLHRSIISPLLSSLFEKRKDCAFIVSTHEVMLPVDNPTAHTLLLRSCEYENSQAKSWTGDFLSPEARIDDELKRDILGARQKIIFVEGAASSLDGPLYSLLFPQVSVISKASCRDVEQTVRSLREAEEMHWLRAWGIVDNDRRSQEDIERLRDRGVLALPYYSVESIYYHPEMIRRVVERKNDLTGEDPTALFKAAVDGALQKIEKQRDHLVSKVVEKLARQDVFARLPTKENIQDNCPVNIRVDVAELRTTEENKFDALVQDRNFEGLVRRYPVRESGALGEIEKWIGLEGKKYASAVQKLLQEDGGALEYFRGLFGELLEEINSRKLNPKPALPCVLSNGRLLVVQCPGQLAPGG